MIPSVAVELKRLQFVALATQLILSFKNKSFVVKAFIMAFETIVAP
jgi:hypothetical protein